MVFAGHITDFDFPMEKQRFDDDLHTLFSVTPVSNPTHVLVSPRTKVQMAVGQNQRDNERGQTSGRFGP